MGCLLSGVVKVIWKDYLPCEQDNSHKFHPIRVYICVKNWWGISRTMVYMAHGIKYLLLWQLSVLSQIPLQKREFLTLSTPLPTPDDQTPNFQARKAVKSESPPIKIYAPPSQVSTDTGSSSGGGRSPSASRNSISGTTT